MATVPIGTELITIGGSRVQLCEIDMRGNQGARAWVTILSTSIDPKRNVGKDYPVFVEDGKHVGGSQHWCISEYADYTECPY
jgi:hypothetical protein